MILLRYTKSRYEWLQNTSNGDNLKRFLFEIGNFFLILNT